MELEELRKKRKILKDNSEVILNNMQALANESNRVADIAHDSRKILDELDREFARQTGLDVTDFAFLFFATALQVSRIMLINKLTQIEDAGKGDLEKNLKKVQKKVLGKLDDGQQNHAADYYAPLNQIITTAGVPYDVTEYESEKFGLFDGANHRFATVGHDPVLGLIFGTANILTNTITTVDESLLGLGRKGHKTRKIPIGKPLIESHHVRYDEKTLKNTVGRGLDRRQVTTLGFSTPKIGEQCLTPMVIKKAAERVGDDNRAVVAAVIKQIIHIGTDMYTPRGIQIPGANLILSNDVVEKLTNYVSTGDIIKIGASAGLAALINLIIGTLHGLTFDETKYASRNVFAVKTKKILLISNSIATGSNLIWVGANVAGGNEAAIKDLDIGGLIVTINRLITDTKFIRQVKEEFVFGTFNELIQGEPLELQEVKIWD